MSAYIRSKFTSVTRPIRGRWLGICVQMKSARVTVLSAIASLDEIDIHLEFNATALCDRLREIGPVPP
jgi:hypothetical protein